MTITYKNIPMIFDKNQFVTDLRKEYRLAKSTGEINSHEEWAILCLEIEPSTLHTWVSTSSIDRDILPLMGTFLHICNALGTDPRKYFVLQADDE